MAHRHQLPSFYPPTYSASPAPPWGQQQQQQQHVQQPQQSTSAGAGYAQSVSDYGLPPPGLPVDTASNNNNFGGADDDQYSDSPGPNTRGSAAGGGTGNGADDASEGLDGQAGEKKKPTRGARACLHCRRLKVSNYTRLSPRHTHAVLTPATAQMRCTEAENGPPCKRCRQGGHEVSLVEFQRPITGQNGNSQVFRRRPVTTRSASLRRVSAASGATAKPMRW